MDPRYGGREVLGAAQTVLKTLSARCIALKTIWRILGSLFDQSLN